MTSITAPAPTSATPRPGLWSRVRERVGGGEVLAGGVLLGILVLLAATAPWIAPHDPEAIVSSRVLAGPDLTHPFGSDQLGRDVFSRVLFAFRASLSVAIGSVVLAALIGVPIGLIAGFKGGRVDAFLMRPLDLLLALPALLLALGLIAIVGPGAFVTLVAVALIYVPILARVVRGSVMITRQQPYVDAARARGATERSVMVRHVLPNSMGPALIQATVLMGFAIQIEAALSFLGLGAQPPTPSLGVMLSEGRDYLTQAPWVEIFPGVAIAFTVLALTLIGDGLSRRLDPRGMAR